MNIRVLATALAAIGCGLAVTMVSCNSDKNGIADAPNQPTHGGKAPQALAAGCNSLLAIDRCGLGGAELAYDHFTSTLSATNLRDASSGVKSTFADAHDWRQVLRTSMPAAAGDKLSAIAYDNDTRQARLDITVSDADASVISITPTFDAGDGIFKAQVYDHGSLVAEKEGLTSGSHIDEPSRIIPIYLGFGVWTFWVIGNEKKGGTHLDGANAGVQVGSCLWTVGSPDDASVDIKLPDGTVAHGNEIRMIEQVDGSGRYPYHSTNHMDVLSNLGKFDVTGESASN